MQQQIQLNIIPFKPVSEKVTFAFYGEKQPDTINASIKWDKLFDEFPEDRDPAQKSYYSDFQSSGEGAFIKEIDFFEAVSFAQKYFRFLIYNYFRSKEEVLVFHNFIDDVEVWIKDSSIPHNDYKVYDKYSMKIQFKCVTKGFELVLAYDGQSRISRTNLGELSTYIEPGNFKLIACNGSIFKHDPSSDKYHGAIENQYPVLNTALSKILLNEKRENKLQNQYTNHHDHIAFFYNTYLKGPDFNTIINLSDTGFHMVPQDDVHHVDKDSNLLRFKEDTHINPGYGINKFKPFNSGVEGNLKIFFIYHKDDRHLIDTYIGNYIKRGWHKNVDNVEKHFKTLFSYIDRNIFIDEVKNIVFNNIDTLYEEVSPKIASFLPGPNSKYIAIMISPVSKLDKDHPQHIAYYRIKEQLLYKDITSQVLYREHLPKESFYYFLPNIFTAMLAKLGGIPWQLAKPVNDDIIIGIGAFKPQDSKHRFVGSAFCFSKEGLFEGFNCFREDDTTMLAGSIKAAVKTFKTQKQNLKRIIIHFYKEISDHNELQPILKALNEAGEADTPVIIITINKTESKELLGFDMKSEGKMPISGSHIEVGRKKYLLFNNTRYFGTNGSLSVRDYHFPIKLSMRSTKPELLDDLALVRQLVNQVYQFSRMYWKSTSQQNIPVTTAYPEMVAKIYPHFEHYNLPEFGQKNLWFL